MIELEQNDMQQFADFNVERHTHTAVGPTHLAEHPGTGTMALFGVALVVQAVGLVALLAPIGAAILARFGLDITTLPGLDWLLTGANNLVLGGGLLFGGILLALIARFLVMRNRALWASAGCPQCREHDMLRIQRQNSDRAISLFVPVRRYACRNCTWQGRRLVGRHELLVAEATAVVEDDNRAEETAVVELEEALLPDTDVVTLVEDVDTAVSEPSTMVEERVEGVEETAVVETDDPAPAETPTDEDEVEPLPRYEHAPLPDSEAHWDA